MMNEWRTGVLLRLKEPAAEEADNDTMDQALTPSHSGLSEAAFVVLGYVGKYPEGIHGYHLGKILSRSPLRLSSLGLGQLYRLLHRLEKAGLVISSVEEESARLRYRFTITQRGEADFSEWLRSVPEGSGTTSESVLDRLRFAEQLPGAVLLRLIDEAHRECERKVEELAKYELKGERTPMSQRYARALRARLGADRLWLDEIRQLVAGSVTSGAAQTPEVVKTSPLKAGATDSR